MVALPQLDNDILILSFVISVALLTPFKSTLTSIIRLLKLLYPVGTFSSLIWYKSVELGVNSISLIFITPFAYFLLLFVL